MSASDVRDRRERLYPVSGRIADDRFSEGIGRVVHRLRLWRERIRARNELAQLDMRMLADIGMSPADRDFLVNKPFWRE
jgi:uncharacterized protein YjiS (DUF1127 family)